MGMGKRRQKLCVAKRVSGVSSKAGSSEVDASSLGMFRAISGWSKKVHPNFPGLLACVVLQCPQKVCSLAYSCRVSLSL